MERLHLNSIGAASSFVMKYYLLIMRLTINKDSQLYRESKEKLSIVGPTATDNFYSV